MAKTEETRAKQLLLQGIPRKKVKEILMREFDSNGNILSIAVTRAAKEIAEAKEQEKNNK